MQIPDRRLALLALLGMVNYTPTWFRPAAACAPARSPTATATCCSRPTDQPPTTERTTMSATATTS